MLPQTSLRHATGLFGAALREHQACFQRVAALEPQVLEAGARLAACLAAGGKVLCCGLGPSAALAQHLAALWGGALAPVHAPRAVLALSGEQAAGQASVEDGLARQVQALGRPGDALLLLALDGGALALKRAADLAGEQGLLTVGLLGPEGRELLESCHLALVVPGPTLARAQEAQQFIGHALAVVIEDALAGH